MGIIAALLVGLIAGALAKLIMPGRDGGGIIVTTALGVTGALVAYIIGSAVGWYDSARGEAPGLIASIVGAVIVLGAYRALARRW